LQVPSERVGNFSLGTAIRVAKERKHATVAVSVRCLRHQVRRKGTDVHRVEHEEDGRLTSAIVTGEGVTVTLLPGFLQSAQRFVDVGWVEALSAHFRVVAVDPAGYGEASKRHLPEDYTADAFVSDLFGIYDLLGVEQTHLVGYSQGSGRACYLAHRYPGRARSLVFGGAPLFDQGARFRELGFDVDGMFAQAIAGLKAADWPAFWEVFPAPLSDETKRFLESVNDPVSAGYVLEATRSAFPPFEPPTVATMAFWGSGERFHDANHTAASEAGIESHVVDGEHDGAFTGVNAAMDAIIPFLTLNE
jgi:pimeloyl-ACP methyl ester carboxylesterase